VEESGHGLNAVVARLLLEGSQGVHKRRYWGRGLKPSPPEIKKIFVVVIIYTINVLILPQCCNLLSGHYRFGGIYFFYPHGKRAHFKIKNIFVFLF
jgi:hypothetical protein